MFVVAIAAVFLLFFFDVVDFVFNYAHEEAQGFLDFVVAVFVEPIGFIVLAVVCEGAFFKVGLAFIEVVTDFVGLNALAEEDGVELHDIDGSLDAEGDFGGYFLGCKGLVFNTLFGIFLAEDTEFVVDLFLGDREADIDGIGQGLAALAVGAVDAAVEDDISYLKDDLLTMGYEEVLLDDRFVVKVLLNGKPERGGTGVLGSLNGIKSSAFHEDRGVVAADGGVHAGNHAAAGGTETFVRVVAEGDEDAVVEGDVAVEGATAVGKVGNVVAFAVNGDFVADDFDSVAVTMAANGVVGIAYGEGGVTAAREVVVDVVDTLPAKRLIGGIAFDGDAVEHGVMSVEGDAVGRVEPVECVDSVVRRSTGEIDQKAEVLGVLHGFFHVLDGFG